MKRISLFILVVICAAATAYGQTQLRYNVVGSGGDEATSPNYGMRGTVGQTGIGTTTSPSYDGYVGYWYLRGATATGASDEPATPQDFSIDQNRPNPFNPTTTIQFSVPTRSQVTLKIYDVSGSLVKTLVDGSVPPGVHREVWDASGVASGVYFYRIEAPGFVQTKKLVLLK